MARLYITSELLIELCKAQKDGPPRYFKVTENPLPPDARFIGISSDGPVLQLSVTSETFDDVDADKIPVLPPPVLSTVFSDSLIGGSEN